MESARGDETAANSAESAVVTRGREIDQVSTVAVLAAVEEPTVAWADEEVTIVASGAAATISTNGADRFETIKRDGNALFADRSVASAVPRIARPRLFGGFAFHVNPARGSDGLWSGFPDARFVLPAMQLVDTGEGAWLVTNARGPNASSKADERLDRWGRRMAAIDGRAETPPPGIESRTFTPDESGWRTQVTEAVDRIERGELQKVVLAQSQRVELGSEFSIPGAVERLGETYPDCYRFAFAPGDDRTFFGATPETLVSRDGRQVWTEALAGSTGRGDTPAEDEWLARSLQESEKDRHEQRLVVEAIKSQLDPYATSISTGDRTVRTLASVQHLRTPITAELGEDDHVLDLVDALHPTPAVGGLPPDVALETIRETEAFDRGWYASPVGWFDAEGNGTFAVAIRSAVANGDAATLFAGNGIVADSDPDREWDEVRLKYQPILDTLE